MLLFTDCWLRWTKWSLFWIYLWVNRRQKKMIIDFYCRKSSYFPSSTTHFRNALDKIKWMTHLQWISFKYRFEQALKRNISRKYGYAYFLVKIKKEKKSKLKFSSIFKGSKKKNYKFKTWIVHINQDDGYANLLSLLFKLRLNQW